MRRLWLRLRTLLALIAHLSSRGRYFLLPMIFVVLLASALLIATGGLSYVAPFVYALF
ncbi:MAG TPA: DUF5989 family protein [Myxococcota bacterium]|jgi:hypothetical protein